MSRDPFLAHAVDAYNEAAGRGPDSRQQRLARGALLSCALSAATSLARIANSLEHLVDGSQPGV